jgi:hypothetical protein
MIPIFQLGLLHDDDQLELDLTFNIHFPDRPLIHLPAFTVYASSPVTRATTHLDKPHHRKNVDTSVERLERRLTGPSNSLAPRYTVI